MRGSGSISSNNELISYHTFIFPFEFEGTGHEKTFRDIIENAQSSNWKHSGLFNINIPNKGGASGKIPNYNEYNYFNEQARDILYESEKKCENCTSNCIDNGASVCFNKSESFFFEKNPKNYEYIIKKTIKKENPEEIINYEYSLKVDDITLRIFKHNIGILSFHLENYKYKSIDDILRINQYGRRIYPPFLVYDKDQNLSISIPELASSISIDDISCDFGGYNNISTDNITQTQLKFLTEILGNAFNDFKITSLVDDRMFVVCWYGNDELSNRLNTCDETKKEFVFESDDKWYEMLFVDNPGGCSCQNEVMKRDLIKKYTYTRWTNYSTFFGISRYSFICLTNDLNTLRRNNAEFIVNHMRTIYYQMIVISFVQRISILKFKKRIGNAIEKYLGKENISNNVNEDDKFNEELEKIQEDYLEFINRICLREITPQEQGIELYNMMRGSMEIDESSKALKEEISEIFNLSVYKDKKRQKLRDDGEKERAEKLNDVMNAIAVISGVLGISSLLSAFMDFNTKDFRAISFILIFMALTYFLAYMSWKNINKNKNFELSKIFKDRVLIIIVISMILITILYLLLVSDNISIDDLYEKITQIINQ